MSEQSDPYQLIATKVSLFYDLSKANLRTPSFAKTLKSLLSMKSLIKQAFQLLLQSPMESHSKLTEKKDILHREY